MTINLQSKLILRFLKKNLKYPNSLTLSIIVINQDQSPSIRKLNYSTVFSKNILIISIVLPYLYLALKMSILIICRQSVTLNIHKNSK